MRFICGDRFVEMSNFVYTIDNPDDYYRHPNTFSKEAVEAFSGIPIIYTLTGNAKSLLLELSKVNKKVVLITHSADVPIDKELYNLIPHNVIQWFSQTRHISETAFMLFLLALRILNGRSSIISTSQRCC